MVNHPSQGRLSAVHWINKKDFLHEHFELEPEYWVPVPVPFFLQTQNPLSAVIEPFPLHFQRHDE